jgi:hypothetical protein
MIDTPHMSLPLLAPAQAQKHVTVNEALARIDALTHLTLVSTSLTTPPNAAMEGDLFAVPPGGVNAWAGQEGKLAIAVNGGWVFVTPRRGWRAFVQDQGMSAIWDGSDWRIGALTLSSSGSAMSLKTNEIDVAITSGPALVTAAVIPSRALLFGITGRVIDPITGTATSWDLGVSEDTARFGAGIGVSLNAWVNGPTAPMVYWSPTPLVITAQDGDFSGGMVRLALHYADLGLPDPI